MESHMHQRDSTVIIFKKKLKGGYLAFKLLRYFCIHIF